MPCISIAMPSTPTRSAEAGGRCRKSRLDKLIRFEACRTLQVPATPIDTMVIANPKLNTATVAVPNINWPSWRENSSTVIEAGQRIRLPVMTLLPLVVSWHAICSASQLMVRAVELPGHGSVAPSLVVRPTGTKRHGGA